MTDFINPYTFVPLVAEPNRLPPASHAFLGEGRLSGVLQVTLTTRTPLLIGGYARASSEGEQEPDVPRRADNYRTPMVPGSGFLGALRSIHEALAGSCLRVLDTGWAPVHRHPASTAETRDLRLAVVLEVDGGGRPVTVGLCDQVVWLDQALLPVDGDRLARTGDRLRIPAAAAVDSGDRKVLRPADMDPADVVLMAGMSAAADDSWVLLVTDTKARTRGKPAYFAVGRLGTDSLRCQVPDDGEGAAWSTYHRVVGGADDLRPANLPARMEPEWGSCPPEFADVHWPLAAEGTVAGPPVAMRLKARHYLHVGQPVWVRVDGRIVTEIRLSRLWRYRGDYPVGRRAASAVPCTDAGDLCWSCRVFGSADTSGRQDDDASRQSSYRGHIRVDDLLATAPFEPIRWRLAPLAAPKASAGQFYLDNSAVSNQKRLARKDTRPAARWGSCADDDGERPIRGRKFYWRTKGPDKADHPRGAHRHQSDTQSRDVVLVPSGIVFTGRVCFDNLSAEDYGSLLAALDPRLLSGAGLDGWEEVVTSVGGGKPFGFGAVSVDVRVEKAETAGGRYLGLAEDVPVAGEAVKAFRAAVPRKASVTWDALRNALTFGFIQDDMVWYPPGTEGAKGDADFDRSFEFFARTVGLELKDKVRELVVLPPAAGAAASQVLSSTAGERAIATEASQRSRGGRAPGRGEGGRP